MLSGLARPSVASKAILFVFLLLCLVLAIQLVAVLSGRYPRPMILVDALPMLFFLWAIWSIRRAVVLVGEGAALRGLLSSLLARVGAALLLGGLALVFGVPILARLISGGGSFARYDVSAITVGVVGVGLMIVARLVADAEAMRAELDEIV